MSLETGQSVKHRWSYGDRKHAVDALFSPEDTDMYEINLVLALAILGQLYGHNIIPITPLQNDGSYMGWG